MIGFAGWNLTHSINFAVDENMFYKGVDKSAVHGARLHQAHSSTDAAVDGQSEQAPDAHQPPYPFVVCPNIYILMFDLLFIDVFS